MAELHLTHVNLLLHDHCFMESKQSMVQWYLQQKDFARWKTTCERARNTLRYFSSVSSPSISPEIPANLNYNLTLFESFINTALFSPDSELGLPVYYQVFGRKSKFISAVTGQGSNSCTVDCSASDDFTTICASKRNFFLLFGTFKLCKLGHVTSIAWKSFIWKWQHFFLCP